MAATEITPIPGKVALLLLDELNRTETLFPGTDLRLVYELPENAAKPAIGVA